MRAHETPFAHEIADSVAVLIAEYQEQVATYSEGGWVALIFPGFTLPPDLGRGSIPADAIYPRLVPSGSDGSWRLAYEAGPDGTPDFSASMVGRAQGEPEEHGPGSPGGSLDWLDL